MEKKNLLKIAARGGVSLANGLKLQVVPRPPPSLAPPTGNLQQGETSNYQAVSVACNGEEV